MIGAAKERARTAVIYHADSVRHDTGEFHPETALRAKRVFDYLKRSSLVGAIDFVEPSMADLAVVAEVHAEDYIRSIEADCAAGRRVMDQGDTRACPESYRVAMLAAGSAIAGVDCVLSGEYRTAFSCMRPPGHHARPNLAMGFCFFNNAAIAARYAQRRHAVERVLIVDWDVHHGNGTQEIFYADSSVLFFSTHQYPYYPGSGGKDERGSGPGAGYTVNVPMGVGADLGDYRRVFAEELRPVAGRFGPDVILISAGFDAHRDDPLASIGLRTADFGVLTEMVVGIAEEYCEGRIVSILEGGYNLGALERSAACHVGALANRARVDE